MRIHGVSLSVDQEFNGTERGGTGIGRAGLYRGAIAFRVRHRRAVCHSRGNANLALHTLGRAHDGGRLREQERKQQRRYGSGQDASHSRMEQQAHDSFSIRHGAVGLKIQNHSRMTPPTMSDRRAGYRSWDRQLGGFHNSDER
jgi:hypothetical protein